MLIKITIFYWVLALINAFLCQGIRQSWFYDFDPITKLSISINDPNYKPRWLDIWITITGLSIAIGFILIIIATFCLLFL